MALTQVLTRALIGLLSGALIGSIHFSTLRWNVRLLTTGTLARAMSLQIARMVVLGLAFFALAKLGAWALLSGAAGLLLARQWFIRLARAQ